MRSMARNSSGNRELNWESIADKVPHELAQLRFAFTDSGRANRGVEQGLRAMRQGGPVRSRHHDS